MYRPTRPRLRTLSLTLALGMLVALFGAGAVHAQEECADPPADEVSSSLVNGSQKHLALFDVYWNDSTDENDPNSQTLVTNPCPPLVVHSTSGGFGGGTTTTRAASDVDIRHTIIHIPSSELQKAAEGDTPAVQSFKRTVRASGTGDYDGTKYDFLRPKLANGTRAASADVWVVPACHEEEEAGTPTPTDLDPPFCLGFSAGLLTLGDWAADPADTSQNPPVEVQYEFEAIRQPGHATEAGGWGDFFVFHVENGELDVMWRTDEADTNAYEITPGTYDHAYWAFTKPGTYVFHVQAKGYPNHNRPGDAISDATTVTSEVRRYTFHVGDLTVNQDPIFEVTRSVPENTVFGNNVGDPICVNDIDDDTLCFNLHGHGAHENFIIHRSPDPNNKCGSFTAVNRSAATGPICAEIHVKIGASLDYETTASYDLELEVSDRQDHESNPDGQHIHVDDSIAVTIDVEDENPEPTINLTVSSSSATVGTNITLSWSSENLQGAYFTVHGSRDGAAAFFREPARSGEEVTSSSSGEVKYRVQARYDNRKKEVYSDWVTVNWTAGSGGPGE